MLQSLGRGYVKHINSLYRPMETFWEGCKARLASSDDDLLTFHRYVELNPVRAGMVNQPQDYQWSSYRRNALDLADDLVVGHEAHV